MVGARRTNIENCWVHGWGCKIKIKSMEITHLSSWAWLKERAGGTWDIPCGCPESMRRAKIKMAETRAPPNPLTHRAVPKHTCKCLSVNNSTTTSIGLSISIIKHEFQGWLVHFVNVPCDPLQQIIVSLIALSRLKTKGTSSSCNLVKSCERQQKTTACKENKSFACASSSVSFLYTQHALPNCRTWCAFRALQRFIFSLTPITEASTLFQRRRPGEVTRLTVAVHLGMVNRVRTKYKSITDKE